MHAEVVILTTEMTLSMGPLVYVKKLMNVVTTGVDSVLQDKPPDSDENNNEHDNMDTSVAPPVAEGDSPVVAAGNIVSTPQESTSGVAPQGQQSL